MSSLEEIKRLRAEYVDRMPEPGTPGWWSFIGPLAINGEGIYGYIDPLLVGGATVLGPFSGVRKGGEG